MLSTVLAITALGALAPLASSSVGHEVPVAGLPPPVVTATSSQYFERTFNQLVGSLVPEPTIPVQPVLPARPVIPSQLPEVIQNHAVLPAQPQHVLPFHSVLSAQAPPVIPAYPVISNNPVLPVQRPVFFQPTPNTGNPTFNFVNANQPNASQTPLDPNVAIAIATAHSAAPVATFLLPPYPFGLPPLGFVPPAPFNTPEEPREESTTQSPSTDIQTTVTEPEQTTPQPSASSSNTDNAFAQGLPNQNVNFRYGPPPDIPRPLQPFPLQGEPEQFRPQKLKTSVEIVPVPLTYMSPPPLTYAQLHHYHQPHHHHQPYHHHQPHHHHHHEKIVKYYVQTVPAPVRAKIIIRPVTSSVPVKLRYKSKPVILKKYRVPVSWERSDVGYPQMARLEPSRDIEQTTMGPLNTSNTKPPRV